MSDEAALKLADAMNRLASAIERVSSNSIMQPGINVNHGALPSPQPVQWWYQCGTASYCGPA